MRILITHLSDPACGMGGAEQVVLDIARSMKEIFHETVACAVNESRLSEEFKKADLPVTELYWEKRQTLQTFKNLRQMIHDFRPDIIHSHHRYLTFLMDLFLKKGRIILHTEHLLRRNRRAFFRYGHFATAVADSVRNNLIEYFNLPPERVLTIPNAVSLRRPDPRIVQQLQQRFPRPERGFLILFLGRLEEQKGHKILIEAVEKLEPETRKRLKILIVGKGTLEAPLRQEVLSRTLDPFFEFVGFLPQVPELLAISDFLILPSLYEGMPLVVLEAFCAGKTVLATDIPGTREVVQNHRNGLLVPPRDPEKLAEALRYWLDHPEEKDKCAQQAYADGRENFSFQEMMQKYHDLYSTLISEAHE